jgi:hypothetical protein
MLSLCFSRQSIRTIVPVSPVKSSSVLTVLQFTTKILSQGSAEVVEGEVEVILRPTVSRTRLGVRPPSGTRNKFFFLLEIISSQLRVYYL